MRTRLKFRRTVVYINHSDANLSNQERYDIVSSAFCLLIKEIDARSKGARGVMGRRKDETFSTRLSLSFSTFPSPLTLPSVARLSFLVYPPRASPASCQERRLGTSQLLRDLSISTYEKGRGGGGWGVGVVSWKKLSPLFVFFCSMKEKKPTAIFLGSG